MTASATLSFLVREALGTEEQLELEGLGPAEVGHWCAVGALAVAERFLEGSPPPYPGASLTLLLHPELAFHLASYSRLRPFLRLGGESPPALLAPTNTLLRELQAVVDGESPRLDDARC